MVSIDIEKYIDELKGFSSSEEDLDSYSLKRELIDLNKSTKIFEDFEKETRIVDKEVLSQIQDLSLLIKIKNLASEIKSKSQINENLHSLHFNLNLLKNDLGMSNAKSIKNTLNVFLYNDKTKIDNIVNQLNDFKAKLDEIKKCHSNLLPESLDNKLKIENKYNKHIEQLYSVHKRQKNALVLTIKLFLKLTKKHIKTYKNLNNKSKFF